ncbi:hypothetical protein L208DRAFT_1310985, partial [Tricholoma matsutake]
EEAVLKLRGILASKYLPPLEETPKTAVSCYKYLHQVVKLTGLGEASFSQAIAASQKIYGMFDCQFLDGALESWSLSHLGDSETECLDASNQYFMPSKDTPGMKSTPFHIGIDPQHILANMMSGEDGERRYGNPTCHCTFVLKDNLQSNRFKKCEPQMFCVGDIVKVQLSFVGVPLKETCWKMLVALWSIALLDRQFSMVHQRAQPKKCLHNLCPME